MLNDFLPISAERLLLANFLIESTVEQDNHRMLYIQYKLEETKKRLTTVHDYPSISRLLSGPN